MMQGLAILAIRDDTIQFRVGIINGCVNIINENTEQQES
jgi:hypothetical protein